MPRPAFDPDRHTYTVNGLEIPSVTEVLEDNGMTPDYTFVDPFYAERGTAVHKAVALDLLGQLDTETLDEHTAPYVQRARRFIELLAIVPRVIEHRWACGIYQYGGTLDLFCDSKLGPLLLDWKSGAFDESHKVQVAGGYLPLLEQAAYEGAVPIDTDEVLRSRIGVVTLDRDIPKPHWVERNGQVEIFRAALAMTNWRRQHQRSKRA